MEREPKIMGTEEAIAGLIRELIKIDKSRAKIVSDLSDGEIGPLAILETLGQVAKIRCLNDFCANFCLFRISRFRLGRRELVSIASFSEATVQERRKRVSLKDLIPSL